MWNERRDQDGVGVGVGDGHSLEKAGERPGQGQSQRPRQRCRKTGPSLHDTRSQNRRANDREDYQSGKEQRGGGAALSLEGLLTTHKALVHASIG